METTAGAHDDQHQGGEDLEEQRGRAAPRVSWPPASGPAGGAVPASRRPAPSGPIPAASRGRPPGVRISAKGGELVDLGAVPEVGEGLPAGDAQGELLQHRRKLGLEGPAAASSPAGASRRRPQRPRPWRPCSGARPASVSTSSGTPTPADRGGWGGASSGRTGLPLRKSRLGRTSSPATSPPWYEEQWCKNWR